MKSMPTQVILASGSPRRKALLSLVIDDFSSIPLDIDESFPRGMEAHDVATYLARKKAEVAQKKWNSNSLIITADTTVLHEGTLLEKPRSTDEASDFLNKLSDSWHEVITAACISYEGNMRIDTSINRVRFDKIPSEDIRKYIDSGSPMDKAGGYGIQDDFGKKFIQRIEGDYQAIMGLQISWIRKKLTEILV